MTINDICTMNFWRHFDVWVYFGAMSRHFFVWKVLLKALFRSLSELLRVVTILTIPVLNPA
jgi:hypothetical protein